MFSDFIRNRSTQLSIDIDPKSISVYPISEYNLEGVKILIDNCLRMGKEDNNNVIMATVDPSLWLPEFLDKHWNKISYVSNNPSFGITKVEGGRIILKNYRVDSIKFDTDEEIDEFFNKGKWKKFVLFSIVKHANLSIMKTHYSIRYSDITEKFEERDNKINEILKDGTNNN